MISDEELARLEADMNMGLLLRPEAALRLIAEVRRLREESSCSCGNAGASQGHSESCNITRFHKLKQRVQELEKALSLFIAFDKYVAVDNHLSLWEQALDRARAALAGTSHE